MPYDERYHYGLFVSIRARKGDRVFVHDPNVIYAIGDTITIDTVTFYVVAADQLSIGDADPLVRYVLLSIYPPPDVPNVWNKEWGPIGSNTLQIYYGTPNAKYIDYYEIWRSFDGTNYHFLTTDKEGPFEDFYVAPIENIWYKIRAVDTFDRKSDFTRSVYFQQEWQRWAGNPVLQPTALAWDSWGVTCPHVIYNEGDSEIHMFYGGMTGPAAGYQIGHATISTTNWKAENYTNWVKDLANPVMTPAGAGFMANGVFEPFVRRMGSWWVTYHTGYDNHNGTGMDAAGIGAFYSPTLNGPWNVVSNAVPRVPLGGVGDWDEYVVFAASAIYEGDDFFIYYSAASAAAPNTWKIGRASANWALDVFTKDAVNNPILSPHGTDWEQDRVFFLRYYPFGTFLIGYYQGWSNAQNTQQWGTCWSGSPEGAITRTPFNPDMRRVAPGTNEATLRIGGCLFKDPFTNRFHFFYGSGDAGPSTIAEIRQMILTPILI
jgi:hypothetical protein